MEYPGYDDPYYHQFNYSENGGLPYLESAYNMHQLYPI
uniref:Uncharacterized protein n=1 Tax=Anguilla anguilla TaxID=7936 RepID=A0A0E9RG77_ANGAN